MRAQSGFVRVMVLVALFYAAMLPLVLRYLDPVTGDEPFYIMTAISMVRDRDLNEENNYANRDYDEFYPPDPLPAHWEGWPAFPRTLPPHPAISEREGLFTKHGLGLSVLIALPYELGGRSAAVLVVMLCAVLLAGQMYLLAREAGASDLVATLVTVGLAIAMPLAPYALLIFPEIPAALLIIYTIRRLSMQKNSTAQWLLTGGAIGFLPWLHQRFAVLSVVFAVVLLVRLWHRRSLAAGLALVPVAVGGFSLLGYNQWLYGQLTQNTEDHGGFSNLTGTLNGATGMFLDAQWGLLIAAPVLLLGLAALPHWWRADRRRATIALASVAPYLLVVAAYQVWWGEWCPPARYLVPVVPLLAGPFGAWLLRATRPQQVTVAVAWLAGMVLTVIGFAQPQRFYHHPDGINQLYQRAGELFRVDLANLLAAYQPYSPDDFWTRFVWAMLALLVFLGAVVWINLPRATHD